MKRFFILLVCVFMQITASAQYLTIKGVEISGSAKSFISKIKQQGFMDVPNGANKETTALKGTFAGVSNSYLIVYHDQDVMSQVVVLLEGHSKWTDAKIEYQSFKELYKEKYKVEPRSREYFNRPYEEFSGFEYKEFEDGRAKYASSFNVDNGVITISIKPIYRLNDLWEHMNYSSGFITTITYVNSADAQKLKEKYMEDL